MPALRPVLLAALLATTPAAATADPAPVGPYRLRCEIDFGQPPPTVQFYRLSPAAGEVLAEPDSLYTRAGVQEESEALVWTNTVESWTNDEVVFSFEVRSKTGPQTSTYRKSLNLKTLALRLENTTHLGGLTLHPSIHHGRCKRVAMDAARKARRGRALPPGPYDALMRRTRLPHRNPMRGGGSAGRSTPRSRGGRSPSCASPPKSVPTTPPIRPDSGGTASGR